MTDEKPPQIASTTPYALSESDWERFEKYVIRTLGNGCDIWVGSTRDGYGMFNLNGKPVSAHRVAYFAKYPDTEPSLSVRHLKCLNRACVNAEHMSTGPSKWQGKKMPVKVTPAQIDEIKEALATPYRGQVTDLARRYGVSHSYISHIKKTVLSS